MGGVVRTQKTKSLSSLVFLQPAPLLLLVHTLSCDHLPTDYVVKFPTVSIVHAGHVSVAGFQFHPSTT